MLPGMTVIVPCDYQQTKAATKAIANHKGPVYLRFGRPVWPIFTTPDQPFVIGKAQQFSTGSDISIFACGHMVWKAIEAGKILEEKGNQRRPNQYPYKKPLDKEAVLNSNS
jgi:transketolase